MRGRFFVPDGREPGAAAERVTHLAVGAHPDDLEFMAFHGIAECFGKEDRWFGGVTVTAGSNPPRVGPYAGVSTAEIVRIRLEEQEAAARLGGYGFQASLGYESEEVVSRAGEVVGDLVKLFEASTPGAVYLHQPFDRHPTHVAVFLRSIEALLRLDPGKRPERVWGCEVWRGLDWVDAESRHGLDTSCHAELAEALFRVYRSQIDGGKRYDRGVVGRWEANATFGASHRVDGPARVAWALDLTPLVREVDPEPLGRYMAGFWERFAAGQRELIARSSA